MPDYEPIRGYRIVPEQKNERVLSTNYLMQDARAAKLDQELWRKAPGVMNPETGNIENAANCLNREDEFSGETLMSDTEAALECATCPLFDLCSEYGNVARPAWGTFGGRVFGRALEEAMKEDV
jgi:hypothetical protein